MAVQIFALFPMFREQIKVGMIEHSVSCYPVYRGVREILFNHNRAILSTYSTLKEFLFCIVEFMRAVLKDYLYLTDYCQKLSD